ncbi:ABC-three component system protein [Dermacoccus barathri]|uniref:ABC-three component systems C-terminal domain-containing protein n=1 Tax=Dermacoccus barathri TaxID=322601 RepID=A0ABN2BCY6_9MICO
MSASPAGVVLSDLPEPAACPPLILAGPPVPPAHRIFFYSSGEWEEFIKEWALGLDETYVQVKRLGGGGDEGIDVAGFKSDQQLEGPWDCFQGKHYAGPIGPSDAWPEILKVFLHVVASDYVMPDTYRFLAPKGCSTTLNRLLSKPSKLRKRFLEAVADGRSLVKGIDAETLGRVRGLAQETDFSMFRSVELHEALDTHKKTPHYVARFGGAHLPAPSPFPEPPDEFGEHEVTYISELRKVYAEGCADDLSNANNFGGHPTFGEHFKRQRYSFYAAESVRMDARDAVPDGTFERLQDDVYDGVIETAAAQHDSRMKRLTAVLEHSTVVDLSSHPLVSWAAPQARRGICHQLANDERLTWTPKEQS